MFARTKTALLGLTVAVAAVWAAPAQAAIYTDLSAGGFTITEVSDSSGAFGQPTLTADGQLTFTNTNFGFVTSNGGSNGATHRLTFKVTLDTASAPTAQLSEYGVFQTLGTGGLWNVFPHIAIINDPLQIPLTPIDSDTGTLDISGNDWSSTVSVRDAEPITSYWVIIDNDILALANQGGVVSVDKKLVVVCLGDECEGGPGPIDVPEPASLGVLGLGAIALLARRRK